MPRLVAIAIIGLLKVSVLWAVTVLVVIPWTLSQEHYIHLLGILVLGGGAIIAGCILTIRISKKTWKAIFPGKS